jgi:hypothetical protein
MKQLNAPRINRVFYLDPKLYAAGSRDSSFRTFYFEPKITTNKSARRRRPPSGRLRTRAKKQWPLELYPLGPSRPRPFQSPPKSRIPRQQPRHLSRRRNISHEQPVIQYLIPTLIRNVLTPVLNKRGISIFLR